MRVRCSRTTAFELRIGAISRSCASSTHCPPARHSARSRCRSRSSSSAARGSPSRAAVPANIVARVPAGVTSDALELVPQPVLGHPGLRHRGGDRVVVVPDQALVDAAERGQVLAPDAPDAGREPRSTGSGRRPAAGPARRTPPRRSRSGRRPGRRASAGGRRPATRRRPGASSHVGAPERPRHGRQRRRRAQPLDVQPGAQPRPAGAARSARAARRTPRAARSPRGAAGSSAQARARSRSSASRSCQRSWCSVKTSSNWSRISTRGAREAVGVAAARQRGEARRVKRPSPASTSAPSSVLREAGQQRVGEGVDARPAGRRGACSRSGGQHLEPCAPRAPGSARPTAARSCPAPETA